MRTPLSICSLGSSAELGEELTKSQRESKHRLATLKYRLIILMLAPASRSRPATQEVLVIVRKVQLSPTGNYRRRVDSASVSRSPGLLDPGSSLGWSRERLHNQLEARCRPQQQRLHQAAEPCQMGKHLLVSAGMATEQQQQVVMLLASSLAKQQDGEPRRRRRRSKPSHLALLLLPSKVGKMSKIKMIQRTSRRNMPRLKPQKYWRIQP